MTENKKWSVNKILTLIGSILSTFAPLMLLLIGAVIMAMSASPDALASYESAHPEMNVAAFSSIIQVIGGLFLFSALVSAGLVVCNWIAFVKIDGPKGNTWRTYLLISGIVFTVFGLPYWIIGAAPGVLFILAFALNRKPKAATVVETENFPFSEKTVESAADSPISEEEAVISETSESSEVTSDSESSADDWEVSKNGEVTKD